MLATGGEPERPWPRPAQPPRLPLCGQDRQFHGATVRGTPRVQQRPLRYVDPALLRIIGAIGPITVRTHEACPLTRHTEARSLDSRPFSRVARSARRVVGAQ